MYTVLISLLNGEMTQEDYMNYNSIKTIKIGLPRRIYGFILPYRNLNIIAINKYISNEKYNLTLLHEFAHIELNHTNKIGLDFKLEGIEDEADRYVRYLKKWIEEEKK